MAEIEEKEKAKIEAKEREAKFQATLEGLTRDEKRRKEIEYEETLSSRERQLRHFSWLENAPVEGEHVKKLNVKLHHKPFGIQIKNVRCFKLVCGDIELVMQSVYIHVLILLIHIE